MMETPWLLSFDEAVSGKHGAASVGGKGRQLADMHAMRLRHATVPLGAVVPTAAYRYHLGSLGLSDRFPTIAHLTKEALEGLRAEVIAMALHPDLRAAVRAFVVDSGRAMSADARFAVRSSGAAEDGAAASFAGQYETVLNVRGLESI